MIQFNFVTVDNFQVIFKSLRSRAIYYNAIVGESSNDCDRFDMNKIGQRKSNIFPYKCDHCELVFKFFRLLEEHCKVNGVVLKSFHCNICKFIGINKWNLKRHVFKKHQFQ